jgi:hypothetical protein
MWQEHITCISHENAQYFRDIEEYSLRSNIIYALLGYIPTLETIVSFHSERVGLNLHMKIFVMTVASLSASSGKTGT